MHYNTVWECVEYIEMNPVRARGADFYPRVRPSMLTLTNMKFCGGNLT